MSASDQPLLTPTQRRLVGTALGFGSVVAIFALTAVSASLIGRFLAQFSSVIWPIATAGILALILRPVVIVFERVLRGRRLAAVILLYGLVLLGAAGIFLAVAPAVISQMVDFVAYLPVLWQKSLGWSERHFPEWLDVARRYLENPTVKSAADSLAQQAQDLVGHLAPSLKQAGAGLFGFFAVLASLAIIPVYLFFFLLSAATDPAQKLENHLTFLRKEQRADLVYLVREFVGILVAFFRGQLLIGLIMGVLLAIGFSIGGLRFGLALGLIIGLLNIVPYLGSILGLSVALPLALLQPQGGWPLVAIVLGVFVVVQLIESWLLTPRIMGEQTGLHPVAIIFAIFFWGTAFNGVLGMLLAVPLTAFFVTAWRLLQRKYFGQAESGV
ncbi:MAG: AI-2E family transporter [Candidatus Didemnitutus sp.]|nr:AI-2E family transporter [Candidatus Didemnitutus sp.]